MRLLYSHNRQQTTTDVETELMNQFELAGHEYIELCNLLKVLGWCGSGGEAKIRIDSGEATVDGNVELRKRCKIRAGQRVNFDGEEVTVV